MLSALAFRKRIAFLNGFPRLGGAERSLLELVSRIDRDRFDPCLVTAEEGELSREAVRLDIPVHFCPIPASLSEMSRTALAPATLCGAPVPLLRYLGRLDRCLRATRAHMIYSNAMKDHIASALLRPFLCKPVVWHFRDTVEVRTFRIFIEVLALTTSTHLIANSNFTASQFPRLLQRRGKCTVVYNGMNLVEIDRLRKRGTEGVVPADDGIVVGIVGALCPEKGQELLIRALRPVASELPVSCWIVGDEMYETSRHVRGYRAHLEKTARELDIRDRVHFLGWRRDVVALLDRMDLLVCASNPELSIETFGRTVTEAMACAKPVVSVAHGGPLETVVDGVTGRLFKDYAPEPLSRAILELARDRDRRERMGHAGRERVEQCFTLEQYVRGVETCIEDVLAS